MRDYTIITDSGCDLSKEMVEEHGIEVVPMKLMIDGVDYRHYHDCRELSMDDFYAKICAGHIGQTSCVSTGDAMETMRKVLEKGKDVLYLSFSSGMSGSYNSARLAGMTLKEEYPDAHIEVVDTLSGSVGLGMLTYLAVKRKALGETLASVANFVKTHCLNINHYFTVADLKYIHRTGRISSLKMIAGTIIGVRPIFKLDDDGKVALQCNARGKRGAIRTLMEQVKQKVSKQDLFFICHADAEEDANILSSQIKEEYPNAEIHVGPVGPILGNNTGPGALAVIFYGDAR